MYIGGGASRACSNFDTFFMLFVKIHIYRLQKGSCKEVVVFVMEQQTFIENKCQEELVMINEDEKHKMMVLQG